MGVIKISTSFKKDRHLYLVHKRLFCTQIYLGLFAASKNYTAGDIQILNAFTYLGMI